MTFRKLGLVVAATFVVGAAAPALAQAQGAARPPPPAADDEFTAGLRRIGVLAGQAMECATGGAKEKILGETLIMGQQIANHFGINAAFNFTGAVGYGSGRPFDKADCAKATNGWAEVQQKYLPK